MSRKSLTDDLLAEVRATAAADARDEATRLAAARAAKEAEEQQRRLETQLRAENEARLRIEAEARRQALVDEQRRRLAAGPEPEVVQVPVSAPVFVEDSPAEPTPPTGRSAGFWFVVVSLPALCLTAVALSWILAERSPPVFSAPPPAVLPEVAAGPETVSGVELMPTAHAVATPEVKPVAVAAPPSARPIRTARPPRVRPEAPTTRALSLDNLLETDDTRR